MPLSFCRGINKDNNDDVINLMQLGGSPCFDLCVIALVASFWGARTLHRTGPTNATVFDYKPGGAIWFM